MTKQFLFSFLISVFFANVFLAQATLTLVDCYTLQATFEPLSAVPTAATEVYSFVLEKEVLPGLWQKVKAVESPIRQQPFPGLAPATYRVTVISPRYFTEHKTKMYHHLAATQSKQVEQANTFLSNTLTIHRDDDCDFGHKKNEQHTVRQHSRLLSIYPNPSRDRLWISWDTNTPVEKISLYSLTGHMLQQVSPEGRSAEVDLTGISPGIYLLKATHRETVLAIERISVIR